jgi:tetratricopeptide (TPR) repeat protein
VRLALFGAIVGEIVEQILDIDVVSTSALFWVLAGAGVGLGAAVEDPSHLLTFDVLPKRRIRPTTILIGGILVLLFLADVDLNAAQLIADVDARRSLDSNLPWPTRLDDAYRAVRLWPTESTYRVGLSSLETEQADNGQSPFFAFKLAAYDARQAVEQHPLDPELWMTLGQLELHTAHAINDGVALANGETDFQRAIELAPSVAIYHRRYGVSYYAVGQMQLAIAELKSATRLDPTDPVAWWYLSEAYQSIGDQQDAADAFVRAIGLTTH